MLSPVSIHKNLSSHAWIVIQSTLHLLDCLPLGVSEDPHTLVVNCFSLHLISFAQVAVTIFWYCGTAARRVGFRVGARPTGWNTDNTDTASMNDWHDHACPSCD